MAPSGETWSKAARPPFHEPDVAIQWRVSLSALNPTTSLLWVRESSIFDQDHQTVEESSNMRRSFNNRFRGDGFRFGLESEYLLVDAATFRPLSHRELTFGELNETLESIPVEDLPPARGMELLRPHRRVMHYYVEGYHVPDVDAAVPDIIPKGIEIRTPPCGSIAETLELLATLHQRLQEALLQRGRQAVALSYHPVDDHFSGPQGNRNHDRWQWVMQAMLTYGPDVNISLPSALAGQLNEADLFAKVNFYAPSLVALCVASPFHRGQPWIINGRVGKSLRTYRRSPVGQSLRLHPGQGGRLEFKSFEMSHRLGDFHAYLLLWLTLLLDDALAGRGSVPSRIDDLAAAACDGLAVDHLRDRAAEVLDRGARVLPAFGFDPGPLKPFVDRVAARRVPADEILALHENEQSMYRALRHLARLQPESEVAASTPVPVVPLAGAGRSCVPLLAGV
jgi:carboxylate-amine ligase